MNTLILLLPALALLRHRSKATWVALYGYALVLLTMMSAEGAIPGAEISDGVANAGRAGVHLAAFCILSVVAIKRRIVRPRLPALAALAGVAWMVVSIIAVPEAHTSSFLRLGLLALVVTNMFVLIPSLRWGSEDTEALIRALIIVAVGASLISAYTIYRYGFFPTWQVRLGRPLNPNVLAYLLTVTLIASFASPHRKWIRPLLLAGILLCGSRLNIGLAFVAVAAMAFRSRGLTKRKLFGAISLAGVLAAVAALPDRFFARGSALSGREELWTDAMAEISVNPWFGNAGLTSVEGQRAHNLFLEQSLSFGIPLAVFSALLYLSLMLGARSRAGSVMAFALFAAGFVSTTSWTNLGDGGMLLAITFIAAGQYSARVMRRVPATM